MQRVDRPGETMQFFFGERRLTSDGEERNGEHSDRSHASIVESPRSARKP
jgi:hypothetical protein